MLEEAEQMLQHLDVCFPPCCMGLLHNRSLGESFIEVVISQAQRSDRVLRVLPALDELEGFEIVQGLARSAVLQEALQFRCC